MHILSITYRLPYPSDKEERIRAFHKSRYLAARYEVGFFHLADSTGEIDNNAPYLRDICRKVHVGAVPGPFEYFRAAAVAVAPFRASRGLHNKIAEALAVGAPVRSSSRGASAVGPTERGRLFAVDSSCDFADKAVEEGANCKVCQALKERTHIVCDQLSWASRLRNLSRLINEAVAEAVPRCKAEILANDSIEQR